MKILTSYRKEKQINEKENSKPAKQTEILSSEDKVINYEILNSQIAQSKKAKVETPPHPQPQPQSQP